MTKPFDFEDYKKKRDAVPELPSHKFSHESLKEIKFICDDSVSILFDDPLNPARLTMLNSINMSNYEAKEMAKYILDVLGE